MLNEKGFDQWAEGYEQSVALSDADDRQKGVSGEHRLL